MKSFEKKILNFNLARHKYNHQRELYSSTAKWLNKALALNAKLSSNKDTDDLLSTQMPFIRLEDYLLGQMNLVHDLPIKMMLWPKFVKAIKLYEAHQSKPAYVLIHKISKLIKDTIAMPNDKAEARIIIAIFQHKLDWPLAKFIKLAQDNTDNTYLLIHPLEQLKLSYSQLAHLLSTPEDRPSVDRWRRDDLKQNQLMNKFIDDENLNSVKDITDTKALRTELSSAMPYLTHKDFYIEAYQQAVATVQLSKTGIIGDFKGMLMLEILLNRSRLEQAKQFSEYQKIKSKSSRLTLYFKLMMIIIDILCNHSTDISDNYAKYMSEHHD